MRKRRESFATGLLCLLPLLLGGCARQEGVKKQAVGSEPTDPAADARRQEEQATADRWASWYEGILVYPTETTLQNQNLILGGLVKEMLEQAKAKRYPGEAADHSGDLYIANLCLDPPANRDCYIVQMGVPRNNIAPPLKITHQAPPNLLQGHIIDWGSDGSVNQLGGSGPARKTLLCTLDRKILPVVDGRPDCQDLYHQWLLETLRRLEALPPYSGLEDEPGGPSRPIPIST